LDTFIEKVYPAVKDLRIAGNYYLFLCGDKEIAFLDVEYWEDYNLYENKDHYVFTLNKRTKDEIIVTIKQVA
jgi:hypothetical protein